MRHVLASRIHHPIAALGFQKGIVSVSMVAIAGVGVMALTAAGLQSIKGAQEQQLVVPTNTQATSRAWAGVEAVQSYLASLDAGQLEALGAAKLETKAMSGTTATVVSNTLNGAVRAITVNVTGRSAGASSTVQAVFHIASETTSGSPIKFKTIDSANINSNLKMEGGIEIIGSQSANLAVTGSVVLSGTVKGINQLCATGDITINSDIDVKRVCTRGNLTLTGAASVTNDVEVMGKVTHNGKSIGVIRANGDVNIIGGSSKAGVVSSRSNINVTGGDARIENAVNALGEVKWTSSNSASVINANGAVNYGGANRPTTINTRSNATISGNVQHLKALGNVALTGWYGQGIQGSLRGAGNLSYTSSHLLRDTVIKGTLSREPNKQTWELTQQITRDPNLVVSVPEVVVEEVNPTVKPAVDVDVYQLKDVANYVFEAEGSKRKVTIRNVNGIADGTYYLGFYDYKWDVPSLARGNYDYLCEAVNSSGKCTAPATPYRTICMGYSASNACIVYTASNKKWAINGITLAPGVAWFDGNLAVEDGKYINTFMATGNITTGGSLKLYSPNYAGYQVVCTDAKNTSPYNISIDYRLSGIAPSDLCASGQMRPTPLANIALMAGGVNSAGTYVGGDITLGASNEIYGSIIAGNLLNTGGSTKVVGSVQAAKSRPGSESGTSTWIEKTTIDLTQLPATFNPSEIPCMTNSAGEGCGGAGSTTTLGGVQIKWTRYL